MVKGSYTSSKELARDLKDQAKLASSFNNPRKAHASEFDPEDIVVLQSYNISFPVELSVSSSTSKNTQRSTDKFPTDLVESIVNIEDVLGCLVKNISKNPKITRIYCQEIEKKS